MYKKFYNYLKFLIFNFFYILYPCKKNFIFSIRLSIVFLIHEIYFSIFKKKFLKYEIDYRAYIKKNLSFYKEQDWFSHNICRWYQIFLKDLIKKKINILEIGSYEGNSSVFFLKTITECKITCVDSFSSHNELQEKSDFNAVYSNFLSNTSLFGKRVTHYKMKSFEYFNLLEKNEKYHKDNKFDLIYIDGSHYYQDIINDANSAKKFLNKEGLLIFDDFLWKYFPKIKDNPVCAIKEFIKKNALDFKILSLGYQVILKKII